MSASQPPLVDDNVITTREATRFDGVQDILLVTAICVYAVAYLVLRMHVQRESPERSDAVIIRRREKREGGSFRVQLQQFINGYYTHINLVELLLNLLACLMYVIETYQALTSDFVRFMELGLSLCFLVLWLLSFSAAESRSRFFLSWTTVIDFFTIIPVLISTAANEKNANVIFLRFVRLVRIFRVIRLARGGPTSEILRGTRTEYEVFLLVFTVCSIIFIATSCYQITESSRRGDLNLDSKAFNIEWHEALYYMVSVVLGRPTVPTSTSFSDGMLVVLVASSVAIIAPMLARVFVSIATDFNHYARPYRREDSSRSHIVVSGALNMRSVQQLVVELQHDDHTYSDVPTIVFLLPKRPSHAIESYISSQGSERCHLIVGEWTRDTLTKQACVQEARAVILLSEWHVTNKNAHDQATIASALEVKLASPWTRVEMMLHRTENIEHVECLPGWSPLPVEAGGRSDIALVNEDVRFAGLALSALCPGAVVFLNNLLSSRRITSSPVEPSWLAEYVEGAKKEVYQCPFSPAMQGNSFARASIAMFRQLGMVLIGVATNNPPGSDRVAASGDIGVAEGDITPMRVILNPPPDFVIGEHDFGFVIAESEGLAARAVDIDSLDETGSPKSPKSLTDTMKSYRDMLSKRYHVESRRTDTANVPGTWQDQCDIISSGYPTATWYEYALGRPIRDVFSNEMSKDEKHDHWKLVRNAYRKELLRSNSDGTFDVPPDLKGHILVCGGTPDCLENLLNSMAKVALFQRVHRRRQHKGDDSLSTEQRDADDAIGRFRTNRWTVVVLSELDPKTLQDIRWKVSHLSDVYCVSGSPLEVAQLKRAKVEQASSCVVLSDVSFAEDSSDSHISGTASNIEINHDLPAALIVSKIARLNPDAFVTVELQRASSARFFESEEGLRAIASSANKAERDKHPRTLFGHMLSRINYTNWRELLDAGFTPSRAAGRLFYNAVPDSLLLRCHYDPLIAAVFRLLMVPFSGTASTPVIMRGIPERYVGKRFVELHCDLAHLGVIPLALYRKPPESATDINSNLLASAQGMRKKRRRRALRNILSNTSTSKHNIQRGMSTAELVDMNWPFPGHVYTNPSPDTLISAGDSLLALEQIAVTSVSDAIDLMTGINTDDPGERRVSRDTGRGRAQGGADAPM